MITLWLACTAGPDSAAPEDPLTEERLGTLTQALVDLGPRMVTSPAEEQAAALVEAVFLGFSFRTCNQLAMKFPEKTVNQHCPRLSEKAESLFGIAVATTLSLLTGQAVESFKNKS